MNETSETPYSLGFRDGKAGVPFFYDPAYVRRFNTHLSRRNYEAGYSVGMREATREWIASHEETPA